MYQVTAYASWDAYHRDRVRLHGTFQLRGAAMEAADACAYPIVDVRDIGQPGRCPGRPWIDPSPANGFVAGEEATIGPLPQGHRFATAPDRPLCADCGADEADLYIPGTYIPRPADDRLVDGPYYAKEA